MEMYFATNEKDEVIGMSSTMIGKSKEPIDVSEEIISELMVDMSGYKVVDKKIVKNNQLFLSVKKDIKKSELSLACHEHIVNGFDGMIGGVIYHFNYDTESQLNFQDTYNLFQNNLLSEVGWTVNTEREKTRISLKKEDFLNVYTKAIKHKNESLDHFYLVALVRLEAAENLEEIQAIQWGNPSNNLSFNTDNMLEKKLREIDGISKETEAQKNYNAYTEAMLMEVIDIAIMG